MTFHIVMDKDTDLDAIAIAAAVGDRPGHATGQLCGRLNAQIHAPAPSAAGRRDDYMRARLIGSPAAWELARQIAAATGPGDTIFCTSENNGFPIAMAAGGRRESPRIAMMVHNINRPRARAAWHLFGLKQKLDLIMSPSRPQIASLTRAGYDPSKCRFVFDQTDINFFSPGPAMPKPRPLVVSVGLEQRDYRTLALATAAMDLDVRISGYSNDAAVLANTFPQTMPLNFHRRFYEWRDLAQLYRDADVVVVALRPNRYAAGVQALLEAMASGRPVIVTSSEGLTGYLDDGDALTVVPQQDAVSMGVAIQALIRDPVAAEVRARRAREIAVSRYATMAYLLTIEQALRELAGRARPH